MAASDALHLRRERWRQNSGVMALADSELKASSLSISWQFAVTRP